MNVINECAAGIVDSCILDKQTIALPVIEVLDGSSVPTTLQKGPTIPHTTIPTP